MLRTFGKAVKNSSASSTVIVQHFGDVLAAEQDLQRLAVVALPFADLAGHRDVRQELHLDLDVALTLARLAAAALDVEREPPRLIAAQSRLRHRGEELPDRREHAGVGRRVGARRPADGRLVDVDHLVEVLEAGERIVLAGALAGVVEHLGGALVQDLGDQRALAGAGDAGDADELAQRDVDVDVLAGCSPARP